MTRYGSTDAASPPSADRPLLRLPVARSPRTRRSTGPHSRTLSDGRRSGGRFAPALQIDAVSAALYTYEASMKDSYTASEAAAALGISLDTLRRWDRAGRITVERDGANRRIV